MEETASCSAGQAGTAGSRCFVDSRSAGALEQAALVQVIHEHLGQVVAGVDRHPFHAVAVADFLEADR